MSHCVMHCFVADSLGYPFFDSTDDSQIVSMAGQSATINSVCAFNVLHMVSFLRRIVY